MSADPGQSRLPLPLVQVPAARRLILSDRLLVVAHRGNPRVEPENTLPAFESALALDVDMVELDYQQAADGTAVVIHDADLDRTTNAIQVFGQGRRVANSTWADLAALDAGGWFGPGRGQVPLATLDDAVRTILPRAIPLIERKSGDAARCVDILRKSGALQHSVVQAFDWAFVTECHRIAPELVLAALGEHELTGAKLDVAKQTGAAVVAWEARRIGAAEIAAIHRSGFKAWVWTVDDPAQMLELAAAGIDGIITNEPALAIRVLAENPRRSVVC